MPALNPSPVQFAASRKGWLAHILDQRQFDKDLAKILRDAANEAEKTVLLALPDDSVRAAQIHLAVAQLRVQSQQLWGRRITPLIKDGIDRSALRATEAIDTLNATLAEAIADPGLTGSFLTAAKNGLTQVRSRYLNNVDLSQQVYKTSAYANGRVDKAINNGLALGKSSKEIAKDVRDMINPNTPGGVSYAAQRLGRTELNNAFHTTTILAAQSQPWTQGFQWNLSGSHPREDECDDLANADDDGLGAGIYAVDDAPEKPHPQCLCFLTTIQPSDSDFVDSLASGQYDDYLDANSDD